MPPDGPAARGSAESLTEEQIAEGLRACGEAATPGQLLSALSLLPRALAELRERREAERRLMAENEARHAELLRQIERLMEEAKR